MTIRKTTPHDLAIVMEIYAYAQAYMIENGNPNQWWTVHPPQALIEEDIRAGLSYVVTDDNPGNANEVIAVFYFNVEEEPTYSKIDGTWLNDCPYGVVHRIAKGARGKGVGAFVLNWCIAQHPNIRIDTHRDNAAMLRLLEKLGYTRCGIIWLDDLGDERIAFQKSGMNGQSVIS